MTHAPQATSPWRVVATAPPSCPQIFRQLRQPGWRVFALCRSSSPELDALSTPPAGATNQPQAGGQSGGTLTVVQGIDVASDSCVALLQVRRVCCRVCRRSARRWSAAALQLTWLAPSLHCTAACAAPRAPGAPC